MVGKRVDFDKWAWYQCVDLFKDYCQKVLGITFWKTWNANQIRVNLYKIFDKKRTQIKGTKDIMQWDIICSIKGTYWHIAVVDSIWWGEIYVLEQNGSGVHPWNWIGPNAIRTHWYPFWFWVGVWRCQKIFDNLQIERAYIDTKLQNVKTDIANTNLYKQSIRYLNK